MMQCGAGVLPPKPQHLSYTDVSFYCTVIISLAVMCPPPLQGWKIAPHKQQREHKDGEEKLLAEFAH